MNTDDYLLMVGQAACCNAATRRNTYDLTRSVLSAGVPGDLVECGVYAGAQVAIMHRACRDAGVTRPIHAFDSFRGVPMPGDKDPADWQGAEGKACSTRENFDGFMRRWGVDGITVHEGWFADTVPAYAETLPFIALLRLDGDLYESTRTCLEHLYPLLVPGGCCIVDDYALSGCRAAVDEYFGEHKPAVIAVEGGGGPVWWRRDA